MDHQSQMPMSMMQQHPHQHMMGQNMMGLPGHMQMMQMSDMGMNNNIPPPQLEAKPAGPAKKRKKAAARAQPTQPPPPMMKPGMNTAPGMDPHGMMMARDPANTIVAQNPFDDFNDPCMQPSVRMPPQGQQFIQGMAGPHLYGPQGQLSYPPGHPQNHQVMMGNGQNMQQMSPNPMQMQHMHMQHPGAPMARQGVLDSSDSRIYPLERCMITNPQNPNAPPIYPCGNCHREVHENGAAIFCESGCNFWFHRECTGLTELAHKLLSSEVYAEWTCDACKNREGQHVPVIKIKP